jgi:hypothetical protein
MLIGLARSLDALGIFHNTESPKNFRRFSTSRRKYLLSVEQHRVDMMKRVTMRILCVADPASQTMVDWLSQFDRPTWDIHLFASAAHDIHYALRHTTVHDLAYITGFKDLARRHSTIKVAGVYWRWLQYPWQSTRGQRISRRVMKRLNPKWHNPAWRLVYTIKRIQPDIVHFLSIESMRFLGVHSKNILKDSYPPTILSDLDYQLSALVAAEDLDNLKKILRLANYYLPYSQQDAELVSEIGVNQQILTPLPTILSKLPRHSLENVRLQDAPHTTQRKTLFLHDSHDWRSRTLVGIRAIELAADSLKDYRIIIWSRDPDVKLSAHLMSVNTGLLTEVIWEPDETTYLKHLTTARIAINLTLTAGNDTQLLQAMQTGAFPVYSPVVDTEKLIEDTKTGLIVPPEDPSIIALAIIRAATDDYMVHEAVRLNTLRFETLVSQVLGRAELAAQTYKDCTVATRAV